MILAGVGIWWVLLARQLRRAVADRDRLPARPVGPRRADADGASPSGSRGCASPTSWTASRWRSRADDAGRPGARRVLPALRLVMVPGHRRDRPLHRDRAPGARCRRRIDGGEGWLTVGAVLEADGRRRAGGSTRTARSPSCSSSESLGRLGALMAVDGEGVLRGVVTSTRSAARCSRRSGRRRRSRGRLGSGAVRPGKRR